MASKELERWDRRVERRDTSKSPVFNKLNIFGGIALLGFAALVLVSLPDLKRYIKISTM